jgi:hypothetical protein
VTVHVRVLIAAARWRRTSIVGFVGITRSRRPVWIRTGRGASIPLTALIVVARRSPAAIVIPARAVSARRAAAVVVIFIGSRRVPTTSSWRTGPVPITACSVVRPTSIGGARLERRRGRRIADILGAFNLLTLEFATIELLHSRAEVLGGLIFHETSE